MDQDVKVKRATFIEVSTKVMEAFAFARPTEVLRAVKVYVGSHYGSNLWQLDSSMANQYFSAWRTCVKLAWQLPRSTHTYFVDHLLSVDRCSGQVCQVLAGAGEEPIQGGCCDVWGGVW